VVYSQYENDEFVRGYNATDNFYMAATDVSFFNYPFLAVKYVSDGFKFDGILGLAR
jgi:hypothetical protein